MIEPNELALVAQLGQRLSEVGNVSTCYVTAELQPFSSAQKPDLVLEPHQGGRAGQSCFIELKLSTRTPSFAWSVEELREHRTFAEEALDEKFYRYIMICTHEPAELTRISLSREGVAILLWDGDFESLVSRVLRSAEVSDHSP